MGIAVTLGGTSAFSIFTAGVCIGGVGQSALALNRFMETGMVLVQGVSSLTWKDGALGIASDCGGLQLGAEGLSLTKGFPVVWGILLNFPVPNCVQSLEWTWLLISPWAFGWMQ